MNQDVRPPRHGAHVRLGTFHRFRPVGVAVLWLLAAACSESDEPFEPDPEPDPEPLAPVDLVEGSTYGDVVFETGNTDDGGQGEPVSGIGCIDDVAAHYHAHLSLFFEGARIAIPAAVGIVDAIFVDGFVVNGECYYWMHTHDGTGLIHIEPPAVGDYTLGQFFDVWGAPLEDGNVAGFEGEVSVFLDGVRYDGDPREIVLESHMHVSLQVGRPLAPMPMYNFQG